MIGFARTSDALACDGVPLAAIARAEGTPVYIYSAATLRQRYRDLDAAFGEYPHAIHYAFKANSTRALVVMLNCPALQPADSKCHAFGSASIEAPPATAPISNSI